MAGFLTNRSATALLFVLTSVCGPAWAAEASSPHAEHTLVLEAGAFLGEFTTTAQLQGPEGGTEISLEDDTGLDEDQTGFRGSLEWRFAERHRLMVGYYEFDRDATRDIARTIVISTPDRSLEFDVGGTVSTRFDWRLVPLSYAYSFVLNDKVEAAASVGVHWIDANVSFEGQGFVNGGPVLEGAAESETASAPLPVFGLELNYALTPRWIVGAHGQYFSLDYDDYSGDLTDIRVVTEYRLGNRVGVGVGYTWFDMDFAEDDDPYQLAISYDYDGLEAFVNVRF